MRASVMASWKGGCAPLEAGGEAVITSSHQMAGSAFQGVPVSDWLREAAAGIYSEGLIHHRL